MLIWNFGQVNTYEGFRAGDTVRGEVVSCFMSPIPTASRFLYYPLSINCLPRALEFFTSKGDTALHTSQSLFWALPPSSLLYLSFCFQSFVFPGNRLASFLTKKKNKISLGDQANYYLTTARNDLGVLMAKSEYRNQMVPISWKEFRDPVTGLRESRKVAKPF